MATADDVIIEARTWAGTPFGHQQPLKGVAVDCTNFIARVAENSGAIPGAGFESNYREQEDGVTMLRLLRDYLDFVPTDEARPADVLALCDEARRHPGIPRHLILLTSSDPYWTGIHASEHGVREHRLDLSFKARIHSVWRVRGLEER